MIINELTSTEACKYYFDQNIIPFYQPIVDENQKIVGYEALGRQYNSSEKRWDNIVNSCKDDVDLLHFDLILLNSMIQSVKSGKFDEIKFLSVNLTHEHSNFQYTGKLLELNYELMKRNIALQLEISEKKRISEPDTLFDLSNNNVSLCIDDFGIEYSNIFRLITLPVNAVKIDRGFFYLSSLSERRFRMLKSILSGIKKNGIKLTCEGIETPQHFIMAKNLGCEYFQGYFWSQAVNLNEQ